MLKGTLNLVSGGGGRSRWTKRTTRGTKHERGVFEEYHKYKCANKPF